MTNYKRKNDKKKESELQKAYRQGFMDGQAQIIERMTKAGILPEINFSPVEIVKL